MFKDLITDFQDFATWLQFGNSLSLKFVIVIMTLKQLFVFVSIYFHLSTTFPSISIIYPFYYITLHQFPSIFFNFHYFLSISIKFHPFASTSTHFYHTDHSNSRYILFIKLAFAFPSFFASQLLLSPVTFLKYILELANIAPIYCFVYLYL